MTIGAKFALIHSAEAGIDKQNFTDYGQMGKIRRDSAVNEPLSAFTWERHCEAESHIHFHFNLRNAEAIQFLRSWIASA